MSDKIVMIHVKAATEAYNNRIIDDINWIRRKYSFSACYEQARNASRILRGFR